MSIQSNPAIFIDFEGNQDSPPTFIGVLEIDGTNEVFTQVILEPAFQVLVPSTRHRQLQKGTLDEVLGMVSSKYDKSVPIFAWSSHEQSTIDALLVNDALRHEWNDRVIDAKFHAKKWARSVFPDHVFEKKDRRGRHTLEQYLSLIEYHVPKVHGAGKTGSRVSAIRIALEKGREFESWPPGLKGHLTKLLAHNEHDCYGLRALVDRVASGA